MTSKLTATLLGLTLSTVATIAPALAASTPEPAVAPTPVADSTDAKVSAPETTDKIATDKKVSKSSADVCPCKRAASVLVGFVLGAPIAVARKSASETVSATRDLVGDTNNPLFIAPAGALSLPFGVFSGCLQGPIYSAINAWKNSDEPFSKGTFSLGSMN